jgi:hypothetical protein
MSPMFSGDFGNYSYTNLPTYMIDLRLVREGDAPVRPGDEVRIAMSAAGSTADAGCSWITAIVGWVPSVLELLRLDNSAAPQQGYAEIPRGASIPPPSDVVTINQGAYKTGKFGGGLPNNDKGMVLLISMKTPGVYSNCPPSGIAITTLVFRAKAVGTSEVKLLSSVQVKSEKSHQVKYGSQETTQVYDSRFPGIIISGKRVPASITVAEATAWDPNDLNRDETVSIEDMLPLVDQYAGKLGSYDPFAFNELRSRAESLVQAVRARSGST